LHGGRSLAGVAHPNFKHGRYSKYLDGTLREAYEEALGEPAESHAEEIALVEARITELLATIDTGQGGSWAAMKNLAAVVRDQPGDAELVEELLRQIEAVDQDWDAWLAVGHAIDRLARLKSLEFQQNVINARVIEKDQAVGLVTMITNELLAAVTRHADEPTALAIRRDASETLRRLVGSRHSDLRPVLVE